MLAKRIAWVALAAGCASGPRIDYETLLRESGPLPPAPAAGEVSADEATLAERADPEVMLRIALARNPGLAEADERLQASVERAGAAGHLPDPELKYEQWGVPLARPWALGDSDTLMVGLRQELPPPGSLAAEARAGVEAARVGRDELRARRLDLAREVEHAYHAYYLADEERRIHLEHVQATERLVELARSNFRVGRGNEQDVLRLATERTRLHADVAVLDQHRRSAAARLNLLMGRPAGAALGPPAPLALRAVRPELAELLAAAEHDRPEVEGRRHAALESAAQLDGARRVATWPRFMVGLDYMWMSGADEEHGYGAMVSMSLPWLNPGHRAHVRAEEHAARAGRRALEAAQLSVSQEVVDAQARYQAARESYRILDEELLPQALRSLEAARAAYSAGGGDGLALFDASRTYLDVRVDRLRAAAALANGVADLQRAVGAALETTALEGGTP